MTNHISLYIRIVGFVIVTALASTPGLVSADWYADIYGGGAFTTKHNTESALPGFTVTAHDVKFDTSGEVGGRAGIWFDRIPWLGVGWMSFTSSRRSGEDRPWRLRRQD